MSFNFNKQDDFSEDTIFEQTKNAFDELERELILKEQELNKLKEEVEGTQEINSLSDTDVVQENKTEELAVLSTKENQAEDFLYLKKEYDESATSAISSNKNKTFTLPYDKKSIEDNNFNQYQELNEITTEKVNEENAGVESINTTINDIGILRTQRIEATSPSHKVKKATQEHINEEIEDFDADLPPLSKSKKRSYLKTGLLFLYTSVIIAIAVSVFFFFNKREQVGTEINNLLSPYLNRKILLDNHIKAEEKLDLPNENSNYLEKALNLEKELQEKADTSILFKSKYQEAISELKNYLWAEYKNSWYIFKDLIKNLENEDGFLISSEQLASKIESEAWTYLDRQLNLSETITEEVRKWLLDELKKVPSNKNTRQILPQIFAFLETKQAYQNFVASYQKDFDFLKREEFLQTLTALQASLLNQDEEKAILIAKELKEEASKVLSTDSQTFLNNLIDETKDSYWLLLLSDIEKEIARGKLFKAKRLYENMDKLIGGNFAKYQDRVLKVKQTLENIDETKNELYLGEVLAFQIKPLILDFKKASVTSSYRELANHNLTPASFVKFLENLYTSNYILIDAGTFFDWKKDLWSLKLPKGKKPVLLYLQDFMEVDAKVKPYFPTKWQLKEEELEFFDAENNLLDDKLAFQILEKFIAEKPDFSFDKARATFMLNSSIFSDETKQDELKKLFRYFKDNLYDFTLSSEILLSQKNKLSAQNINKIDENFLAKSLTRLKEDYDFLGNTYFFTLGERGKFKADAFNVLKSFELQTHLYLTDKPETLREKSFVGLGLLDLRPFTLYRNQFKKYFDNKSIYDSLVEEGHYVRASSTTRRPRKR